MKRSFGFLLTAMAFTLVTLDPVGDLLAHQEVATTQSGEDLKRLEPLKGVYTGIWWYASFPNHYAGEGKYGSREIGEKELNHQAERLVKVIREVKADKTVLELQKQFYDESAQPLKTRQ